MLLKPPFFIATFTMRYFLWIMPLLAISWIQTGCTHAPAAPPPAVLRAVPTDPTTPAYATALLQNYTYATGRLIFNPQNIRLGSPTPPKNQFQRTNKGVQLHISLNQTTHDWSNQNILEYPIEDGDHQLYAFMVDSYKESIKVPQAVFGKSITVRQGRLARSHPIVQPMVLYNMPLGQYTLAPNDSILVDFVLLNTTLSPEGNQVELQLDDQTPWTTTEWQPFSLHQLQPGAHRMRLTLRNAAGQALAAPVEGNFEVIAPAENQ